MVLPFREGSEMATARFGVLAGTIAGSLAAFSCVAIADWPILKRVAWCGVLACSCQRLQEVSAPARLFRLFEEMFQYDSSRSGNRHSHPPEGE